MTSHFTYGHVAITIDLHKNQTYKFDFNVFVKSAPCSNPVSDMSHAYQMYLHQEFLTGQQEQYQFATEAIVVTVLL